MKQSLFFCVAIFVFFSACSKKKYHINGVSFVASNTVVDASHIAPVKKIHANYVALMPFGFIRDLNSPLVEYSKKWQWFGETKQGVAHDAAMFQKHGIKIMLKPQLWVSRGSFTGGIEMNSEEDWQLLEASYEKFILDFARVAQQNKISIFCIGTELEKFVAERSNYWRNLIGKIRKVYDGEITYAANWDEFKRVPFWDALDFIGIDAYFPLTDQHTPTVEEFERGWQSHKQQILKVYHTHQIPVLFTEFGYRSIDYNGQKPWEYSRVEGGVNLQAQQNATKAIFNQFWEESWFAGGFLWKWFHNHHQVGGVHNNRFTPQNKPVEEDIRQFYKQLN